MPVTNARHGLVQRLAARDPGGLAILRGIRTAIVGPLVFAFSVGVLDNEAFALCAFDSAEDVDELRREIVLDEGRVFERVEGVEPVQHQAFGFR